MTTFEKWTTATTEEVWMVVVSAVVTYALILAYTRVTGLRSFSKMSAADFAMTVAVGSLFGSTISSPSPTLVLGGVALAMLFVGQWMLAVLRQRSQRFSKLIDNEPLLLMVRGKILEDNLRRANVTKNDVYGKLREANALSYDHVLAVIFETTGDVSVLHSDDPAALIEPDFIQDVIGKEYLLDGDPPK